jgi:hypothetical protein
MKQLKRFTTAFGHVRCISGYRLVFASSSRTPEISGCLCIPVSKVVNAKLYNTGNFSERHSVLVTAEFSTRGSRAYATLQHDVSTLSHYCVILYNEKIATFLLRDYSTVNKPWPPHTRSFLILLRHLVRLLWSSDQPVAKASTYTGQHNTVRRGRTFMPLAGFDPRSQRPSNQVLYFRPRSHWDRPKWLMLGGKYM